MSTTLLGLFVMASLLRLASLAVSIRNEKALKADGAIEYEANHSRLLAISFTLFYTVTLIEALWRSSQLTRWSMVGIALYIIALGVLLLVWRELGRLWTVKLIISPNHVLNQGRLYQWVRHPNYFLNVIPELIGLALMMGAWLVLLTGLPLFLIILGIRIIQEERIMKHHFPDGATLLFPSGNSTG